MKIGVIIPTKNRFVFLEQAKKMLKEQTLQPDQVEIVDDESPYKDYDIGWRYKLGIERTKDCDFVVFWEDDDYYTTKHIETLFKYYLKDKSGLIGCNKTIFYHLKINRMVVIDHPIHASMFCMGMGARRKIFKRIDDQERFIDLFLTKNCKGIYINDITAIGIKHGIGEVGMKAGHDINDILWQKNLNRKHKSKVIIDKDYNILKMATKHHYEFYKNLI